MHDERKHCVSACWWSVITPLKDKASDGGTSPSPARGDRKRSVNNSVQPAAWAKKSFCLMIPPTRKEAKGKCPLNYTRWKLKSHLLC